MLEEGSEVTLLPVLHHILHEYFYMMMDIVNEEVVVIRNFSRATTTTEVTVSYIEHILSMAPKHFSEDCYSESEF